MEALQDIVKKIESLAKRLGIVELKETPILTVEEQDGSPTVTGVNKIKFSNGTVTNDGGGVVSVSISGGSLTVEELDGTPTQSGVTTLYVTNLSLIDNGVGYATVRTNPGPHYVFGRTIGQSITNGAWRRVLLDDGDETVGTLIEIINSGGNNIAFEPITNAFGIYSLSASVTWAAASGVRHMAIFSEDSGGGGSKSIIASTSIEIGGSNQISQNISLQYHHTDNTLRYALYVYTDTSTTLDTGPLADSEDAEMFFNMTLICLDD